MPLTAIRHVRKMRGGAQAHLIEADDGHWYVVKFRNNPQHRRILVNELIAAELLEYLKIAAPETALIRVDEHFLEKTPEVHLTLGTRQIAIEPGWHFGSRYPGDPSRTAVYDFLPDKLLSGVANLDDFRAILVFDKWVANADGRQCIFYRARLDAPLAGRQAASFQESGTGEHAAFVARMIDHGFAFNGPNWDFPESALQGLYSRRIVYDGVRSLDDFQPWLDLVRHFPEEVMDRAWKRVPPDWIAGEESALEEMLGRLYERRKQIAELIAGCRESRSSPFANWK